MLRTALALVVSLGLCAGALFAEEIRATFVKYSDKELTVKVDGAEKKFKVADDAKIKFGEKEIPAEKYLASEKRKEGDKLTLVVEKDKVVEIKLGGRKKKDN